MVASEIQTAPLHRKAEELGVGRIRYRGYLFLGILGILGIRAQGTGKVSHRDKFWHRNIHHSTDKKIRIQLLKSRDRIKFQLNPQVILRYPAFLPPPTPLLIIPPSPSPPLLIIYSACSTPSWSLHYDHTHTHTDTFPSPPSTQVFKRGFPFTSLRSEILSP